MFPRFQRGEASNHPSLELESPIPISEYLGSNTRFIIEHAATYIGRYRPDGL